MRRTIIKIARTFFCKASRRLIPDIKARHINIDWRGMAAAGNIYRHDYEDVAASRVWQVMEQDFDALRIAINSELSAHP